MLLALSFTLFWMFIPYTEVLQSIVTIERKMELIWYLGANLILAMACWVALQGRFYCHLCPLGTVLAALAKIGACVSEPMQPLAYAVGPATGHARSQSPFKKRQSLSRRWCLRVASAAAIV